MIRKHDAGRDTLGFMLDIGFILCRKCASSHCCAGSHAYWALAYVKAVPHSLIPPSIHKTQCIPTGVGSQIQDPSIGSPLHCH